MKPHRLIIAILILALTASITLAAQDATALQSWTASDGRVIQAKFVKLDGESVVIEKDGQQHTVPFTKLKAESVEQAKRLGVMEDPSPKAERIDISPASFTGKTLEECEGRIGKPTTDLKERFAREYKLNVPGVSRIILQRLNRAVECLDVYYYFPKGTIKSMADAFSTIGLSTDGAEIFVAFPSNEDKDAMLAKSKTLGKISMTSALDKEFWRSIRNINGGFEARWHPAETKFRPPEDLHPDEDLLFVNETYEQSEKRRLNNLTISDSAELSNLTISDSAKLRGDGAFGFPQATSFVLSDQAKARFSAWSNAEWLYVQVAVWADGEDALTKTPQGKELCDQTWLHLDLDADQAREPDEDRTYVLDPEPTKRGLHRRKKAADRRYEMVADSKGRGSIRFVDADNGKKVRVDSFLIPLVEIEKKPGDKIRLVVSGNSFQPSVAFNSAKLTINGKAMFYISMPERHYQDFTLGGQTGSLDPAQVPDGAAK